MVPSQDIHSITSKIRVIKEREEETSNSDNVTLQSTLYLKGETNKVSSDFFNNAFLPEQDLDALLERLKEDLDNVGAESSKISANIEDLAKTYFEEFSQLESELVELSCSVDPAPSKGIEKENDELCLDENYNFKVLELNDQIEGKKLYLEKLEYLESIMKWVEASEQFDNTMTGLKVTDYGANWMRLSIQTSIPVSESFFSQHKLEEAFEQLEQNHELLIEFVEGTLELKNVEMFPNDVFIGDIIEAAKPFWNFISSSSMVEARSSLEWLVRRVQDRVVLCILRQSLVKVAIKSRHSFEYLDRDGIVIAHMAGGVNAYIKMSLGWPVADQPLKLISLKSSDRNAKELSLSFLCKVEEMANSLDVHVRNNITSFMDAIEEILMQQMRVELHSNLL